MKAGEEPKWLKVAAIVLGAAAVVLVTTVALSVARGSSRSTARPPAAGASAMTTATAAATTSASAPPTRDPATSVAAETTEAPPPATPAATPNTLPSGDPLFPGYPRLLPIDQIDHRVSSWIQNGSAATHQVVELAPGVFATYNELVPDLMSYLDGPTDGDCAMRDRYFPSSGGACWSGVGSPP